MERSQAEADELIEQANALRGAGRLAEAAPLYARAAEVYPPYVSFNLVAGDSWYEVGRLGEAAAAYRALVDAIPVHEQGWENLGLVLYQMGHEAAGAAAIARFHELDAGLQPGEASGAVRRYWDSSDIGERAAIVNEIHKSLDPRVPDVLHHFLRLAADDRLAMSRDSDYWAAQASVLVRFGMADFVYWYSDGPAPDREAIASDVRRYLLANLEPPPPEQQQAVWSNPPPRTRQRERRRRWWHRLIRR